MNQNVKPIYLSKTFLINLIMAMSVLVPEQYKPMTVSPEVHAFVFLTINTVLRLISKDKVTII